MKKFTNSKNGGGANSYKIRVNLKDRNILDEKSGVFFRTKNGFTLVELLAVIILLGLLGLIIYPTVNGVINTNKRKLHDKQMEELIRHANTYATTNITKMKTRYGYKNIITFTDLYEAGIIQSDKVVDPLTDRELNGCLILMWNRSRNEFDIEYTETCNKYGSISGVIKGNEYSSSLVVTGSNPIEATVMLVQEDQVYYTTQSDEDGNYSFNNVEVGNYILLVSQPYKTKQGEEVVIDGNVTKDMTVTLYFGDYNNDNMISLRDKKLWQNHCGIHLYDDFFTHDACDVTHDGNVNGIDQNYIGNTNILASKMTQITLSGTFNLSGKVISNGDMPTEIQLMNNDNTYTATINADGTYEFKNIPKGTYRLRARLNRYSLYEPYDIYLGDVENVNVYMYRGDFDSSGDIDEGDIEALMEAIEDGKDGSLSQYKHYDLNNDNVIDNADLAVLRKTMAEYQSRYK